MFVDRAEVRIEAGKGGDGCVAFRREKHVPHGGPSGGDGGNGGSVIVRAREGVNSLVAFAHRKHWRATRGQNGMGSECHGKRGEDLVIEVPPGTVIIDAESGLVIKDLVHDGEQSVVARGGRGGKGNPHFKSSTNQAPREATPGTLGEQRQVIFELKVIADVGLVGKPNAGKSTLLSRLSRARPQIADYPFTTKFPNLGQVVVDIDRTFVMADIPGLIEGAAEGVGLGHDFLRHIMRAGILVHLVEPLPSDGSDPIENYGIIRKELEHYSEELAARPEILVVSKSEIPEAQEVFEKLSAA
ncbi:MAG: GTPase ObgE, partial [Planctomycetales bacterium]|nr:GTPase ObgE [Planctomycetales bacterium]